MGRTPCCEKVGLKKGRWTQEEDDILSKYIQANGEGSWRSLPKNAGLLRCGKSCRLRWINYLRNDLKRGNISRQEEDIIIKLHASLGNKWSFIASQLIGRTDNEIKNYWNSHLSRKIDTFRRPFSEPLPINMNNLVNKITSSKKRSGKTNKSLMKKKKNVCTTTVTTMTSTINNNGNIENNCNNIVPLPSTPSEVSASDLMLYFDDNNEMMDEGLASDQNFNTTMGGEIGSNFDWGEDEMLSWLWQSEHTTNGKEEAQDSTHDSERQEALLAWLFS